MTGNRYPLRYRMLQRLLFPKPLPELSPEKMARLNAKGPPDNAITRWLFGIPGDDIVRTNISFRGEAGLVHGTVFFPRLSDSLQSRPALLFFHGGGWVLGNNSMHDTLCAKLAKRLESTVVSVHYRLAPECPFPGAFRDACSALRWIKEQDQFPYRREMLVVMGTSAGGNLAAALSLHERDSERLNPTGVPRIRGQILVYPVTDCRMNTESYQKFARAPFLGAHDMEFFIDSYLGNCADAADPYCSPLLHSDHSDLPETLLLGADLDPLKDEGRLFAEALRKAEVPVTYHLFRETVHGFLTFPGNRAALKAFGRIETFLEEIRQ